MTLPELAIILPSYPADACFLAMEEKKIAGVITMKPPSRQCAILRRKRPWPRSRHKITP